MISSTMHIPSIRTVDLSFVMPSSSRILIVTTVLVIDIASAKNRESNEVKPSVWATKKTITRVPIDSGTGQLSSLQVYSQ